MTDLLVEKIQSLDLTSISKRGAETASGKDFLSSYFGVASANPYHAVKNPKGIINLGTAVNRLMEQELEKRINTEDALKFKADDHQHYFDYGGTPRCREALSNFFQWHFTMGKPVPPEHLVVLNGVTACLDSIAYCTCDAGDVMITPTPVYGRIFTDFQDRARVDVQPLHLLPKKKSSDPGEDFELRPENLEARIEELIAEGKNVRAFLLVNPQNPLGNIYSSDLVRDLLKVCAKYEIHAIIDEIYALSLIDGAQFSSVLAIEDLPDPQRTHLLWGISKDFGLAGLRFGVIHTTNPHLLRCLGALLQYQVTPSIVHDLVGTLLLDTKWCDEHFLPTSQRRLTACYHLAKKQLEAAGVHVHSSQAALFAWINISPFMKELTEDEEIVVFKELMTAGLYCLPGSVLHCGVMGWFRLVVSVPEEELKEGITRLVGVLHARRPPLEGEADPASSTA